MHQQQRETQEEPADVLSQAECEVLLLALRILKSEQGGRSSEVRTSAELKLKLGLKGKSLRSYQEARVALKHTPPPTPEIVCKELSEIRGLNGCVKTLSASGCECLFCWCPLYR